jgi:hypothetical protein
MVLSLLACDAEHQQLNEKFADELRILPRTLHTGHDLVCAILLTQQRRCAFRSMQMVLPSHQIVLLITSTTARSLQLARH